MTKNIYENITKETYDESIVYATIEEYYPDTQTARVKLVGDGLVTTDIPIQRPYAGVNVGFCTPYYKGQQVKIEGYPNNMSIVGTTFNNNMKSPLSSEALRLKYGILTGGKSLDPFYDSILTNGNNSILLNETKGLILSSNKHINLVSTLPSSTVAPTINKIGNFNVNNPTRSDETVSNIDKRLDDMNNKFAQCMSYCYALSFQIEKFSSLVQLLTLAVHMIGLSPLKIIDIFAVFPALKDNPFTKFFKHKMTELRSITLFGSDLGDILADTLSEVGLENTRNEINNIKNYVKKGEKYTDYLNYLDFDVEKFVKGELDQYDNIIIEKIPGVEEVRNNAIKITNKTSRLLSIAQRFYKLINKQFKRKTNTMYVEYDSNEGELGDFSTELEPVLIATNDDDTTGGSGFEEIVGTVG